MRKILLIILFSPLLLMEGCDCPEYDSFIKVNFIDELGEQYPFPYDSVYAISSVYPIPVSNYLPLDVSQNHSTFVFVKDNIAVDTLALEYTVDYQYVSFFCTEYRAEVSNFKVLPSSTFENVKIKEQNDNHVFEIY